MKKIRSNFIVSFILRCKMEHFKPNFMNLVPGVFVKPNGIPYLCNKTIHFMAGTPFLLHK